MLAFSAMNAWKATRVTNLKYIGFVPGGITEDYKGNNKFGGLLGAIIGASLMWNFPACPRRGRSIVQKAPQVWVHHLF